MAKIIVQPEARNNEITLPKSNAAIFTNQNFLFYFGRHEGMSNNNNNFISLSLDFEESSREGPDSLCQQKSKKKYTLLLVLAAAEKKWV